MKVTRQEVSQKGYAQAISTIQDKQGITRTQASNYLQQYMMEATTIRTIISTESLYDYLYTNRIF